MLIAVILLSVALAVGAAAILLTNRSIANMTDSLKKINDTKTNSIVRLPAPNRRLEKLAAEINRTIEEKHEAEARSCKYIA